MHIATIAMKIYLTILAFFIIPLSTIAQTKLPFIGIRYFNFYGGSGTGESIRINGDGTCIIILYPAGIDTKPILTYEGKYKNPLIIEYYDEKSGKQEFETGYLIKNNKIYLVNKSGRIEKECMGEKTICESSLSR